MAAASRRHGLRGRPCGTPVAVAGGTGRVDRPVHLRRRRRGGFRGGETPPPNAPRNPKFARRAHGAAGDSRCRWRSERRSGFTAATDSRRHDVRPRDYTVTTTPEILPERAALDPAQTCPGGTIAIEVPECGISGEARVLAVRPCPPIQPTPPGYETVTALFRHASASTFDVSIEGEPAPIGSTGNHPFWSADRREFVRADTLRVGERVDTVSGTARVTSITPRGPPEPVFNLQVHGQHVYRVVAGGVLVHNESDGCLGEAARHRTYWEGGRDLLNKFNQGRPYGVSSFLHPDGKRKTAITNDKNGRAFR